MWSDREHLRAYCRPAPEVYEALKANECIGERDQSIFLQTGGRTGISNRIHPAACLWRSSRDHGIWNQVLAQEGE
jgi:hypothetical protein